MMNKLYIVVLFLGVALSDATICSSKDKDEVTTDRQSCKNVTEAYERAFVDLYSNSGDGTFPRRYAGQYDARVSKSFSVDKAKACGRGDGFSQSQALQDILSCELVHRDNKSFIRVTAERAEYEQAQKRFYNAVHNPVQSVDEQHCAQNIFEFYQLDAMHQF